MDQTIEMRKLKASDLPLMMRIVSKVGLENITKAIAGDEVRSLINELFEKKEPNQAEHMGNEAANTEVKDNKLILTGISVVFQISSTILENLASCEKEINTLLSNVSSMPLDQIRELDLEVYTELLIRFLQKEEFKTFFGQVLKLMRK